MNFSIVFKTIGLLLMIFSFSKLPPIVVDMIYQQQQSPLFLSSFFITFLSGLAVWLPVRRANKDFKVREAILVVVSFWLVLSLFGALPFWLMESLHLSFTDAFFESISGLTTTGATILTGLDELPKAILYYRQQMQWLGGMGIIVLAVAVLPMLGVSSMELYHAEFSGIAKDRLTPKLAQTAKVLWKIYIGLTVACAAGYYWAGMDAFDAIGHSFSTVAIGGFSTHDASIGYFNSASIEIVASIFMLVAGINFSLHFFVWKQRDFRCYWRDSELKAYVLFITIAVLFIAFYLTKSNYYAGMEDSLRHAAFQTISLATTAGFTSVNFSDWPIFVAMLLIFTSFVGACASSTAGGIKVVRVLLMFKLGASEVKKIIHPNAQINIKLNKKSVASPILTSIWGFFALYVMAFIVIMLALMGTGLDEMSSFSATIASINNVGPGIGDIADNYANLNDGAKWILTVSMLLGRLEIVTLLALLHRAFWRF